MTTQAETTCSVDELLETSLREVISRSPKLGDWLEHYGNMPVGQYLEAFRSAENYQIEATLYERLSYAASLIGEEAQRLLKNIYGEDIGERVRQQLLRERIVDTGPHLTPAWNQGFVHPFLANTIRRPPDSVGLILADTSIRLDSLPGNPGRVEYHAQGVADIASIALKSRTHDTSVVGASPFSREDMLRLQSTIGGLYANGTVTKEERDNLAQMIRRITHDTSYEEVLACTNLADQLTLINAILFKYLFDTTLRDTIPSLVTLHCERIARTVVQQALDGSINNPLINGIIEDASMRTDIIQLMRGIQVIGSTDLFFAVIHGERRTMRLVQIDGEDYLVDIDASTHRQYRLAINRESILQALQEGTIYPGPGLTYFILMHHGITCSGGRKQSTYLNTFQHALVPYLNRYGFEFDAHLMQHSSEPRISGALFFGFSYHDGDLVPSSGMEMMGRSNPGNRSTGFSAEQLQQVLSLRVRELFLVGLPCIYERMIGARSPIRAEDIARELGILDRLPLFPR